MLSNCVYHTEPSHFAISTVKPRMGEDLQGGKPRGGQHATVNNKVRELETLSGRTTLHLPPPIFGITEKTEELVFGVARTSLSKPLRFIRGGIRTGFLDSLP